MNPICLRVKIIRKEWGLSQVEFAKRLGVTNSHISGIEKGKTVPSDALIKLICKEYKISENWLKNGIEPMMQEDEDMLAEDAIEGMFSEDPLKDAGIIIRSESNRVRLLWAKMILQHQKIMAQKCNSESERYEYFVLCEKLFRDISEMIEDLRTGHGGQLALTFHGDEIVPLTLISKEEIARDIDNLEVYISLHNSDSNE